MHLDEARHISPMIICRSNAYLAAAIRLPDLAFSVAFAFTLFATANSALLPAHSFSAAPTLPKSQ
jgi:hypothetical protein